MSAKYLNYIVLCYIFQAYRIRLCFIKSILRQDLSWHDRHSNKDHAAKLTT